MSSINLNEIFDKVNQEIILKLLTHEEGKIAFSQDVLDYIVQNMSIDDKKACTYLMKNELTELMACPPTSVVKANLHINKMMDILRNNFYILKKIF